MKLDADFFTKLRDYSRDLGVPADWMLLVFYLESRLDPQAHRPGSNYWGLSQINGKYLHDDFGVDPNDYGSWSASEQLDVIMPWYAATLMHYLGHTPSSPGVLYALNLAPGVVRTRGDGADVVLYASPSIEYQKNSGLDVDKNGTITIGDLDTFMQGLAKQPAYRAAVAELGVSRVEVTTKHQIILGAALGLAGVLGAVATKMVLEKRA